MGGGGVNPSEANVADICLYDKQSDKLIIVDGNEFSGDLYPSTNYSPVGVVVVPGHHDVYKDGSCAIVSLKYMSCDTPDIGDYSKTPPYMCYGQNEKNLSIQDYDNVCYAGYRGYVEEEVEGVTSEATLPSDLDSFNLVINQYDTKTYYMFDDYNEKYIPSPYKNDGLFNSEYSRTTSPSSAKNALADFDGVGNTRALCSAATAQSNWKTDSTIRDRGDSGYSPAACCCWRYHTEGTKQNNWYLPAMGELGYVEVRMKSINEIIEKIIMAYEDTVACSINPTNYLMSSSEQGDSSCWVLGVPTGHVRGYTDADKSGVLHAVRAYLRILPNGQPKSY